MIQFAIKLLLSFGFVVFAIPPIIRVTQPIFERYFIDQSAPSLAPYPENVILNQLFALAPQADWPRIVEQINKEMRGTTVLTLRRRRLASHSRRTESRLSDLPICRFSSQIRAHLVKTYGRGDTPSSARATTSSECPRP